MRVAATASRMLVAIVLSGCHRSAVGGDAESITPSVAFDISSSGADDSVRFSRLGIINQVLAPAALLAADHVAILDNDAQQVVIFDSSGRRLHTAGRSGDGPGEFSFIRWIGRCGGDSLYVWDLRHARISVFDTSARLAREFNIPPSTWKIGCNPRGELVTLASPAQTNPLPSAEAPELYSTVLLLSPRGDTVARIDSVPAGRNRPMAPLTEVARTNAHVMIGTADSAVVELFTPTGARLGLLHLAVPPRSPTPAEYQAFIDSVFLAPMPAGRPRDRIREIVSPIPMPSPVANYRQLFSDAAGDAWVVAAWPTDTMVSVYGVRSDGSRLPMVRLPHGTRVIELGSDYALTSRADSDGVDHVILYRYRATR